MEEEIKSKIMRWAGIKPKTAYKIKSNIDPAKEYIVELWGDKWECSCLFNYFRHKECSHIQTARALYKNDTILKGDKTKS
jgi:hypothetical protein